MAKINEIPGQVSFGRAFKDFFIGYFDFKGRTTRAGYWWVTLIFILLTVLTPILVFYALTRSEVLKYYDSSNTDRITGAMIENFWLPFLIFILVGLFLFIPSLAMAVRRYRDAGLRGRGFLVFWVISVAASYTETMSTLQQNSGSAIFTFLTYAIGLLFFILTVLPTNAITTKSNNEFIRFFLREKE